MYFTKVPYLYYPFTINNDTQLIGIKDITHNIRFKEIAKDKITSFETYTILDNETPEIISEKLYGTPNYHWAIMLLNDRFDYLTDFPISVKVFDKYVKEKYEDPYAIHHCQKVINNQVITISNPVKPPVDSPEYPAYMEYISSYGITNYDYEAQLNDDKRILNYIPKELIDYIITEMNNL
jgi:hypothetical protein